MKRLVTLICILHLVCNYGFTQDIIVKKDGTTILSKVLKVGENEVEYKKFNNQNGPTYTIGTDKLQAVNYENGDKDTFESNHANEDNSPKQIDRGPSANNTELINQYKVDFEIKKLKPKNKPASRGIIVFEFTPTSILSNDDIEVSFVRSTATNKGMIGFGTPLYRYEIVINNKTDKFIYIDLGNSFRVPSKGNTYCFYTGMATTVTSGNQSGAAMNMGGITNAIGVKGAVGSLANGLTVGKGSTSSVSKSFEQERIISIPAHGHRALAEFCYEQVSQGFVYDEWQLVSRGEEFCFMDMDLWYGNAYPRKVLLANYWDLQIPKGTVNKDEIKEYTTTDSPLTIDYSITYSQDASFNTYSIIKMSLYAERIIGHTSTCTDTGGFGKLSPYLILGPVDFK